MIYCGKVIVLTKTGKTKEKDYNGKDIIRLPRQYMNTNRICLEPQ